MSSAINVLYKMLDGCEDLAPRRAHDGDAAFDLMSRVDIELPLGRPVLVPTGLRLELPEGYEAQVRPRSGMALKHALGVLNSPGTIDSGYRGEVCVIAYNFGDEPYLVSRGERIAQMVINQLPEIRMVAVENLSETRRGAGGFGSTGKK